jgi:hypothetical protein
MFHILFPWRSNTEPHRSVNPAVDSYPTPRVLSKAKWKKRESQPNPGLVSFTVPPIVGPGDSTNYWQHPHPSSNRSGPSNVAWLRRSDIGDAIEPPRNLTFSMSEVNEKKTSHLHPIGRSLSSPPTSPSYASSSSFSSAAASQWNLPLNSNSKYSQSTHSLRLDIRHSFATDPYGYSTAYPLARQLSPIAEKDYISPASLQQTSPLPPASDQYMSTSMSHSPTSISPHGSQVSDVTRRCQPNICHLLRKCPV